MKKEPEDRTKLKIASFRTTDGDWFDFSQVAESNGLTATDVLKACMVEYQAGTYTPVINTPVSMRIQAAQGLTAEEVQDLIDTAVSTVSNDLLHLQARLIGLTDNWDDMGADVADLREQLSRLTATHTNIDPAAANAYIDRCCAELRAEIEALKANQQNPIATKTPAQSGQSKQGAEIQKWVNRIETNPGLRTAIEDGLEQSLTGKGLTDWVFEKGFGANENSKPFDSSVASRMRGAIEYLDNQP